MKRGCADEHLGYAVRYVQGKYGRKKEDTMDRDRKRTVTKTVETGVSFGSALAMVISYVNWHSVGWAIFHGILSWVYVIYYLLRY